MSPHGSFRKFGVPYLGVLIIRTLLFKVVYLDPLFSETPTYLRHYEVKQGRRDYDRFGTVLDLGF